MYETSAYHFEEDNPGARIENLFGGRSIRFVFGVRMSARPLAIDPNAHCIRHIDLCYTRREFREGRKLIGCFVLRVRGLIWPWMINCGNSCNRRCMIER